MVDTRNHVIPCHWLVLQLGKPNHIGSHWQIQCFEGTPNGQLRTTSFCCTWVHPMAGPCACAPSLHGMVCGCWRRPPYIKASFVPLQGAAECKLQDVFTLKLGVSMDSNFYFTILSMQCEYVWIFGFLGWLPRTSYFAKKCAPYWASLAMSRKPILGDRDKPSQIDTYEQYIMNYYDIFSYTVH